ncbi:MAG: PfkB protein [Chloroflexota bacterium]|nr:PfkB protein [Chloroflexota bacterium]
MPIDFLSIGHITHDRTPDGFRLGGTVSYAAVTARRLGHQPGILTRASLEGLRIAPDADGAERVVASPDGILDGVAIHLLPSSVSTTFTNIYHGDLRERTQVIEALADPILPAELPPAWAAVPAVLLGPIAREVPPVWASVFPNALVGITPQGWMRRWDAQGHVSPTPWENMAEFLTHADVVILSREDVGSDDAFLADLACRAKLLVVTDGWHGATVYRCGESYPVAPRPTEQVDPTGAGDVFATAFLLRMAETGDPLVAARFANIVASMSVEGLGMTRIPRRAAVDAWLEREA